MTTQITTLPPAERAAVALNFDALKAEISKQALQYADITAIENKPARDSFPAQITWPRDSEGREVQE